MNKRWLIALAIAVLWAGIVVTMRRREFLTNVPPPTTSSLAAQVTELSNRVDEHDTEIAGIQSQIKSASDSIKQGQAQVAAAQAGISTLIPG
jgi:peptidoglycan hydrolase CwlO-like protein